LFGTRYGTVQLGGMALALDALLAILILVVARGAPLRPEDQAEDALRLARALHWGLVEKTLAADETRLRELGEDGDHHATQQEGSALRGGLAALFSAESEIMRVELLRGSVGMYTRGEKLQYRAAPTCYRDLLMCWAAFATANELRYTLSEGTLLGQLRNGRIIPYDHDMDVSVSDAAADTIRGWGDDVGMPEEFARRAARLLRGECKGINLERRHLNKEEHENISSDVVLSSVSSDPFAHVGRLVYADPLACSAPFPGGQPSRTWLDITGRWLPADVSERNPEVWASVQAEAKVAGQPVFQYISEHLIDPPFECTVHGPWLNAAGEEEKDDAPGDGVRVMCPAQGARLMSLVYGEAYKTPLYSRYDLKTTTWVK
jgi:hypothetical protein